VTTTNHKSTTEKIVAPVIYGNFSQINLQYFVAFIVHKAGYANRFTFAPSLGKVRP
jgi:hypothetical protein